MPCPQRVEKQSSYLILCVRVCVFFYNYFVSKCIKIRKYNIISEKRITILLLRKQLRLDKISFNLKNTIYLSNSLLARIDQQIEEEEKYIK